MGMHNSIWGNNIDCVSVSTHKSAYTYLRSSKRAKSQFPAPFNQFIEGTWLFNLPVFHLCFEHIL